MTRRILRASGLGRSFRRGPETIRAVRGASLELHEGEIVALAGPSGSGKTSLLALLAGWDRPDEGEIEWGEVRPDSWSDVAIVPQRLGLLEELSIRENVELPLSLAGDPAPPRVDALLDALGIRELEDRVPDETSLGEQQRAAIGRALAGSPRLLLADEPLGHQDAEAAEKVLGVLRDAAQRGTCCLLATHDRESVALADRVLPIRDGVLGP